MTNQIKKIAFVSPGAEEKETKETVERKYCSRAFFIQRESLIIKINLLEGIQKQACWLAFCHTLPEVSRKHLCIAQACEQRIEELQRGSGRVA